MIKLFSVYFPVRTLLLLTTEFLAIWAALLAVGAWHFGVSNSVSGFGGYGFLKLALVALICMFFLYCNNLYAPAFVRDSRKSPSQFLRGLGIASLSIALLYLLVPSLQIYRGFAVLGITLAALTLLTYRPLFFALAGLARKPETVVILGEGRFASAVAKVIVDRPELGYKLAGYIGNQWNSAPYDADLPRLGSVSDLLLVAARISPDRIIVAMGERRSKLPLDELLALKTSGVIVQDGLDFYEVAMGKLPVQSVRTSWLIFSPGFKVSSLVLVYKRAVSVLLASIGLLFFSPFIALIAIAIKFDSKGSIIFRQQRVGLNGKLFELFKFRTMQINADKGGYAHPVQSNDVRVTRVGRFLRRFRLDEIPQFWNILRGDMYLVGPRPFVVEQEQDCARQIPLYSQRWTVRPGATGWAQVQRGYCASLEDNIDKLSYDLFYIKNMSAGLDILILLKTIKVVLSAQGGR